MTVGSRVELGDGSSQERPARVLVVPFPREGKLQGVRAGGDHLKLGGTCWGNLEIPKEVIQRSSGPDRSEVQKGCYTS